MTIDIEARARELAVGMGLRTFMSDLFEAAVTDIAAALTAIARDAREEALRKAASIFEPYCNAEQPFRDVEALIGDRPND